MGFAAFWVSIVCNSATAYTEHQICTRRSWIGGDVVDMPFGVINPTDYRDPNGINKFPKFLRSKNVSFLAHLMQ